MIGKIKQWLYDRFLPMWAKETVLVDNRQLRREIKELEQKNRELEAYIDGLQTGIRGMRRIVINNSGKENKNESIK